MAHLRWRDPAAALLALCAGCTSVVTPPAAPTQPVTVYLLREALHIGLVLPAGDDAAARGFVEYGFGEWAWYALGEEQWYRVFAVVLWPTAGGLCRRSHAAASEAELVAACTTAGRELDAMQVDAAAVRALRARLAAPFVQLAPQVVRRADLDMEFVPAPDSYWFGCTCADVAARWCRELGCDVSWAPIRGSLACRRNGGATRGGS